MALSKRVHHRPERSSSCQGTYGTDAMYWLKWTAGNDVRGRASGVGRRGWNVVCLGVCCTLHLAYPTSPSSPPALRSGAGSTMASTITARRGPALLCLCQRSWCSTPEVCQDCQWLLPLLCHSDGCKSSLQLFCVQ